MDADTKLRAFSAALEWATKHADYNEKAAMLAVLKATTFEPPPLRVTRPAENEVEQLRRTHVAKWSNRSRSNGKPRAYKPTKTNEKWWKALNASERAMTAAELAQQIGKPNRVLAISNVLSALFKGGLVLREGSSGSFAYRVPR